MAGDSCKILQNKCRSIYVNRFYISGSWFYQSRKRKFKISWRNWRTWRNWRIL